MAVILHFQMNSPTNLYLVKDCLEVYLHDLDEIPKWLNDEALSKKINFSAVLKEALIEELHIK